MPYNNALFIPIEFIVHFFDGLSAIMTRLPSLEHVGPSVLKRELFVLNLCRA